MSPCGPQTVPQLDSEVQRRLSAAQAEIHARVAAAVAECAAAIADQARADCPVATGALRDSIASEVVPDADSGVIEGRVHAAAPYAAAVELGSAKTGPRPFLWPALEGRVAELLRHLKELF